MTTLRDLAPHYGLFFVDQFGVLHDGQKPYPGAVEALERLHSGGRKVVILSNSGKRSKANEERFARLGFSAASYDLFLSSGEVAWRRFAEGLRPKRCFILSRDSDISPIEGLAIEVVSAAEHADLVLIAGSQAPDVSMETYRQWLEPAARAGVPALCINPDKTMLSHGDLVFGAGAIADLYIALGGAVDWIGKPYPEIYRAARSILACNAPALGIGDSIEHDVAGAKGVGAAAALVRTGVHRDESDLAPLFRQHGVWPDHVMPAFVW